MKADHPVFRRHVVLPALLLLVATACADRPRAVEAPPIVCAAGQIDGDLHLHVREGVVPPQIVAGFEAQYGVTVTVTHHETDEELITQIEARVGEYDIVIPDDHIVGLLIADGLLIPLTEGAIPNRVNLHPTFANPPFDPSGSFSAGYLWEPSGYALNINVAGDIRQPSWATFFDAELSGPFAGRIAISGDYREAMAGPLKYLGYSLNTTDQEELDAAVDLLVEVQGMLGDYTEEGYARELVDGAADLSQGSADEFHAAIADADAWDDYRFFIPAEGAPMTMQSMVVPITASNPCSAQTFIDFVLDARRGALVSNFNFAATPNRAALQFVNATLLADESLFPPEEVFAELEFIIDLGANESRYIDAFERARS